MDTLPLSFRIGRSPLSLRAAIATCLFAVCLGALRSQTATPASSSPSADTSRSSATSTDPWPTPFYQHSPIPIAPERRLDGAPDLEREPLFELKEFRRRGAFFHLTPDGPVFFPPSPPAMAERFSPKTSPSLPPVYPRELIDYIGEPFYMAYAQLHFLKVLSAKREQRIALYRDAREHQLSELRHHLDDAAALSADEQRSALAAFAVAQSGPLRDLEAEAEAIRVDLTSTRLIVPTENGAVIRHWIDTTTTGERGKTNQFLSLLIAAEFEPGLSLDQRDLLHESAMELEFPPALTPATSSTNPSPYFFFLPATARIRAATDMPVDTTAKIREFTRRKEQLKSELRAMVGTENRFLFDFQRTAAYEELAHRQAPAFAALSQLAEEIRSALATVPYPDEPTGAALSPELTLRVGQLGMKKAELRREVTRRLREMRAAHPRDRIELAPAKDGFAIVVDRAGESDISPGDLAALNQRLNDRFDDLRRETAALREDIQVYAQAHPHEARSADQWASEFNASYLAQENWSHYRDYRRAVLQPGLSEEQRRLLYRSAVIHLIETQEKLSP